MHRVASLRQEETSRKTAGYLDAIPRNLILELEQYNPLLHVHQQVVVRLQLAIVRPPFQDDDTTIDEPVSVRHFMHALVSLIRLEWPSKPSRPLHHQPLPPSLVVLHALQAPHCVPHPLLPRLRRLKQG